MNKEDILGFKVYRLQEKFSAPVSAHFHVFHKIIFLWQGEAEAVIEGKKYSVRPRDVIFISAGDVHKPLLQTDTSYDCTIIGVTPEYLRRYRRNTDDLAECFKVSTVRRMMTNFSPLLDKLDSLTTKDSFTGFADELYREIFFLESMILINQGIHTRTLVQMPHETSNPSVSPLLEYINENLDKKLIIDDLAKNFFFSRYYMMHKFKSEIGVSIYKYVIIKRLFLAKRLLSENYSISQICNKCGFRDYPSFSRAFRTIFLQSPKEYREESQKIF